MSLQNRFVTSLQADGLMLGHCYWPWISTMPQLWLDTLSGVQKCILDMNPKAVFVPCNNHLLNLAGVHAVGVGIHGL